MDIEQATNRLIDLRQATESTDLEKASILADVQETKAYKEKYGDFGAFCDAIGYHRTYAYAVIRAYNNPIVRPVYNEIGALSAQTIAKADKTLDENEIARLVEFAKVNKSGAVRREVKQAKEKANVPAETQAQPAEDMQLAGLLARKSALLARKSDLERELQTIMLDLAHVESIIQGLAD